MIFQMVETNNKRRIRWPTLARFLFLGLSLSLVQTSAAQLDRGAKHVINIELTESVRSALANGVSLTFVCESAIEKRFLGISFKTKKQNTQWRLSYHPLANQYLVKSSQGTIEGFSRFPDVIEYIVDSANEFNVFFSTQFLGQSDSDRNVVNNVESVQGQITRLYLNRFRLPSPLRLNAFIDSDWNINSTWMPWTSDS